MTEKYNLSFGGETFIPINIAKDYLDCDDVVYSLKHLYKHHKSIVHSERTFQSEQVFINGMVLIEGKALFDYWNQKHAGFTSLIWELKLCYGTVNGKECSKPITYPLIAPESLTDTNVYAKQLDLDSLAEHYGIHIAVTASHTEAPAIDSKNKSVSIDDLFTAPPKSHSETFEDIKKPATIYIDNFQELPNKNKLWEFLKENLDYDKAKKSIHLPEANKSIDFDAFTSNFSRWTK